jgi:hypothetical protein
MPLITYTQPEKRVITVYQNDVIANSWAALIMRERVETFLKDVKRKSKLSNGQLFQLVKIYDGLIIDKKFDREQEYFLNDIMERF